jgi:hypothetical protein
MNSKKLPKLWILIYHFGATFPNTLNFPFDGTMTEAMQRAREHCDVMGYRFIKIRPFIVDLDDRERRKKEGKYADESIVLK